MEKYIKVYIKTEKDLPKHEQFFDKHIIFHEKITNHMKVEKEYSSTWNEYFLKEVDWYLLPEEQSQQAVISSDIAKQLLLIRDALIKNDCDEAYRLLYELNDHDFKKNSNEIWKDWEEGKLTQQAVIEHKCELIARACMGEGRDWWCGELTEPVKEYPQETHCLHLKTPVKDVVFLCNKADFEQLQLLGRSITGKLDEDWIESMLKIVQTNAHNVKSVVNVEQAVIIPSDKELLKFAQDNSYTKLSEREKTLIRATKNKIKSQIKVVDLKTVCNEILDYIGYEDTRRDQFIEMYLN